MTTGQVLVLMSAMFTFVAAGVVAVVGGALVWAARRIAPIEAMEAQIIGLRGLVEALDAQVTKLRTSKAGRISNAKRAAIADQQEELGGLDEEEAALFRQAGLMQ